MIPLNPAQLLPPTSTVVASGPGGATVFTNSWYRWLLQIFNRTGGESGVPDQVADDLTATGTTQATALELALDWNFVTAVPAGSGVMLMSLQPGQEQRVYNLDPADALKVYPPPGAAIDAGPENGAYSLAAGKCQVFSAENTVQYRSLQLG